MPARQNFTGSILTPSQREFLRDGPPGDWSPSTERMARSRIRKRLGAAIVDFSTILRSDYFGVDDIEASFTEPVPIESDPIPSDIVLEALAVLFLGGMADENILATGDLAEPFVPESFVEQLRKGIERAVNRIGRRVTDCEVEIRIATVEEPPVDEETDLYRLRPDQLDRLHLANYITEKAYIEAIVRRYYTPPVGEDRIEEETKGDT